MIKAGIVGLGWWGKTLVEGVQGGSSEIQFVAGAARTHTDELKAFAKDNKFELYSTFEDMLNHKGLDAVVLATPHSMHTDQVVAATAKGKHVYCEKPGQEYYREGRAKEEISQDGCEPQAIKGEFQGRALENHGQQRQQKDRAPTQEKSRQIQIHHPDKESEFKYKSGTYRNYGLLSAIRSLIPNKCPPRH